MNDTAHVPAQPDVRRWLAPGAAAVLVGLLVGYPLWELFRTALAEGLPEARDALAAAGTGAAIRNTIAVGLAATLIAVSIALAGAMASEQASPRPRAWMRGAMILPLIVPPFVSALSWDRAYGPGGLTDDLVGLTFPGLFGAAGVILVIAVNAAPVAYLVVVAAKASRREVDLERAARVAGATAPTAFRTVTLPLLRPALIAAAALVFVLAINSFGIPAVLGIPAGFPTMTTRIYQDLALSAAPEAFTRVLVLAAGLVVIAFVAVGAADLKAGSVTAAPSGQPAGSWSPPKRSRRWPAVTLWVYAVATTLVPFLALVLTALTKAVGLSTTPGNWTLGNFQEALDGQSGDAFLNSAWLAIAAAAVVLGIGGLTAAVGRTRLGRGVGTAAVLTFAVPGSALAVAVLLAYGGSLRDSLALMARCGPLE
jgi:iron(III) transport system permease protein